MSFSIAPLLIHDPDLPVAARDELRLAFAAEPARRDVHLAAAARLINAELAIECGDARELVGLPPGGC